MSLFRTQKTSINDSACLVATLEKMGYKNVESHETPQKLNGSPIKGGTDHAEVIVRQKDNPTLYGDLGFVKQPDGTYGIATRMYVERKGNTYLAPEVWMKDLIQEYGVAKARKIAKKNGWKLVTNKADEKTGVVKLQFVVA
jgi:hypothetical protein